MKDIKKTEKPKTRIICPKGVAKKLGDFDFKIRDLKPGDSFYQDKNLKVIAVDTYNLNSSLIWLKIHIKIIETSDMF